MFDIEAKFDEYHGEVTKVAKTVAMIEAEMTKVIDKVTCMQVFGTGTGPTTGSRESWENTPVGAEYSKAFNAYIRKGDSAVGGQHALRELEIKAGLSVGSDPDGGFSALPEYSDRIDSVLRDQSPMRDHCRIVKITGTAFIELIDASDVGSGWVGESDLRPETSSPTLMERKIPVNENYAMPKATGSILDDSSIDIAAWLSQKVGDKFGRDEGTAFVTGDGVNKPRGFLSYPATTEVDFTRAWGKFQYTPTGAASTFASSNPGDALVDLFYSLRAPYRQNAVWMGSSDTARQIRKFKDGQGNYLWQPATVAGQPDMLMGKPWVTNEFMPVVGANTFPVAVGDFSKGYIVVDRVGIRILRDPYSSKPYVLFYTTKRVGGDVGDFNAIKLLKVATS